MTTRVFLLDDHGVVRAGLRSLLEGSDDLVVVGEAATAADALARIPSTRPDVAVLDVRLPDGNGVEVCREIRSRHPQVACLMLTSYADDDALVAAVMAGASGYVLKQVRELDLVEDIRRVAAGESLLKPSFVAKVMERLQADTAEDGRLAALTPQLRRVLELVAEGKTNRQIGNELHLSEKTVKNYVSTILSTLGMERRSQAASYAARLDERSAQRLRKDTSGT
jgi:two-component system, NarL family, response regulator DevR